MTPDDMKAAIHSAEYVQRHGPHNVSASEMDNICRALLHLHSEAEAMRGVVEAADAWATLKDDDDEIEYLNRLFDLVEKYRASTDAGRVWWQVWKGDE